MIQIDPDVFTFDPAEDMSKETFVVTGMTDVAAVTAALGRATDRFMDVDTNGIEHATEESMSDAVVAGADSPNDVIGPWPTARGLTVYVDCKGVIPDPMAATMRTILAEELTAAGYAGRVIAVMPGE